MSNFELIERTSDLWCVAVMDRYMMTRILPANGYFQYLLAGQFWDIECPLHPELAVQITIIQRLMPAPSSHEPVSDRSGCANMGRGSLSAADHFI